MKNNKQAKKLRGKDSNLSYFALRRTIGITGILLPVVCFLTTGRFEQSISHYYYTEAGVFFTSVLAICGIFLISYRGEEWEKEKVSTYFITWFAGILIFIVAFMPTAYSYKNPCDCGPTPICHCDTLRSYIHLAAAVAFFICMGYLSVCRFPQGIRPFNRSKIRRNRFYIASGITMWGVLLFAGVMMITIKDKLPDQFVLIIEIILLILFAASWLVKGKALVYLPWVKDDHGV